MNSIHAPFLPYFDTHHLIFEIKNLLHRGPKGSQVVQTKLKENLMIFKN